ncbi:hypothetical protein ACH518_10090 [Methylomonas sp. HW2-6]|uniref:hypothetical protein n=1 Tax=Methylomonas sp. HW2-6 TaxID=3376687 RepID=UPI004042E6B0
MKSLLPLFISFFSSVTAIKVEGYFRAQGVEASTSIMFAVIIASVIYLAFTYLLLKFPKRFKTTRLLLSKAAALEGHWYEEVDKEENPYSYACIEYDYGSDKFLYYGKNYDRDMSLHATFRAIDVRIEEANNEMRWLFNAQMHAEGKDEVTGFGSITFYKDGHNSFNRGAGYIIDSAAGSVRKIQLNLSRVSKKKLREIIDKNYIETDEDSYKLVDYFRKKPEYNRFILRNQSKPA